MGYGTLALYRPIHRWPAFYRPAITVYCNARNVNRMDHTGRS